MHANGLSSIVAAAVMLLVLLQLPGANAAYDAETAWYALHLCKVSYCEAADIVPWKCGESCSLAHIEVADVAQSLAEKTQAYVGADHQRKQIVIVFRGSHNAYNWYRDLQAHQIPYRPDVCKDCFVHKGFFISYESLRMSIQRDVQALVKKHPDYSIFITGHSLGAAMATLSAAEYGSLYKGVKKVHLYSFESPRVGNAAFSMYFSSLLFVNDNEAYRISHGADPVFHAPMRFSNYRHAPSELYYKEGASYHDPPTTCDDIDKDEDPKCGRSHWAWNFNDHTNIFGTCTKCVCDGVDYDVSPEFNALIGLYNEMERVALEEETCH